MGLELVGCVARRVGDDDFVADEQRRLAAVGLLECGVFADALDARQQQIAGARLQRGVVEQPGRIVVGEAARGVGALGAGHAVRQQRRAA
jgi:hypothetical protein